MPPPMLPYKRPFFQLSLPPNEIQVWLEVVYSANMPCLERRAANSVGQATAMPLSHSRFQPPSPKLVALQEDLAIIITHTKRVRRRGASPPPSGRHKDS